MSKSTKRVFCVAVAILGVLGIRGLSVSGQEARAKDDVLQALMIEVRGLRMAMEQMAAAGPRVQLAMGRLQIQEQRLSAARRRLEDLRDTIAGAERDMAETRDRMAMMEDAGQRQADPSERETLTGQVRMSKAMLAQKAAEIQRLKDQEAELTGIVGAEEGRWTEISQRLDELERALSPRR